MPSVKIGQIKSWILGSMYAAGILIAGSDGDWFPWFNYAGLFIVGIFMLVVTRIFSNHKIGRK